LQNILSTESKVNECALNDENLDCKQPENLDAVNTQNNTEGAESLQLLNNFLNENDQLKNKSQFYYFYQG
jgi:hypothetical protein